MHRVEPALLRGHAARRLHARPAAAGEPPRHLDPRLRPRRERAVELRVLRGRLGQHRERAEAGAGRAHGRPQRPLAHRVERQQGVAHRRHPGAERAGVLRLRRGRRVEAAARGRDRGLGRPELAAVRPAVADPRQVGAARRRARQAHVVGIAGGRLLHRAEAAVGCPVDDLERPRRPAAGHRLRRPGHRQIAAAVERELDRIGERRGVERHGRAEAVGAAERRLRAHEVAVVLEPRDRHLAARRDRDPRLGAEAPERPRCAEAPAGPPHRDLQRVAAPGPRDHRRAVRADRRDDITPAPERPRRAEASPLHERGAHLGRRGGRAAARGDHALAGGVDRHRG